MINIKNLKTGDKIKAKLTNNSENHILRCNDGFSIDLSEFVEIHKREDGVMMAGGLSLSTYENRDIQVIKEVCNE